MQHQVLYAFWRNNIGGLEKIMFDYYKYFQQYNTPADFFILKPNNYQGFFKNKISKNIHFGSENTFLALIKFFKLLLSKKYSILHLSNGGPILLFLSLLFTGKVIYHIHGTKYLQSKKFRRMHKFIWNIGLSNSGLSIIANSNASKESFQEHFHFRKNIEILPNPIDTKTFSLKENYRSKIREVFYLGRWSSGKNLILWTDLVGNSPLQAFLYGDGDQKDIVVSHIERNKYDNISINGFTRYPENIYKKHDLFLFLSKHESFGNVVIEALLCGTPVLALDIPVMKELLKDFPIFLLDKDKDVKSQFVEKIKCFDQLKCEAVKASVAFSAKYDLNTHINNLQTIYNQ